MTSLAEVYEDHVGGEASPRQLYAGVGLFLAGAVLVVAGIVIATINPLGLFGVEAWQAWGPAGILAGLGLPAVFLGIFTVLPASREVRAAAVVGASIAVLGVALFAHAYPSQWAHADSNLVPLVTLVYFVGAITTFWCLFTAVATLKTRNDPGGTVTLEIQRGDETRVVEVDRDAIDGDIAEMAAKEGTNVLDGATDGGVHTRTNTIENRTAGAVRPANEGSARSQESQGGHATDARTESQPRSTVDSGANSGTDWGALGSTPSSNPTDPGGPTPASDGGATEPGVRTPADDAEVMRATANPSKSADSYCGNCTHFRYVNTSRGIRPFCELQDGVMDGMDACEEWEPNQMG